MLKVEEEIRKLIGIPEDEKIIDVYPYKKKERIYYYIETYDSQRKKRNFYHVPKKLEEKVLALNKQRKEILMQLKEFTEYGIKIFQEIEKIENLKEVLENIYKETFKVEAKTYAYQKFKKEAMELYERFKQYLFKLKKEGMRRISILQALYLLANIYELFKDRGEEELEKALNRAVMTILLRDRNLKLENPFGVLRNDLFLPKETPYNFLLSPFLSMELEEILEKLLEAEKEKLIVEEAMAKISEFLANLSDKAKERILKVFNSFEEFSKALYGNWKESKEDLKEFLNEWKYYLEMEVRTEEEEREILRFLKSLKMKEG